MTKIKEYRLACEANIVSIIYKNYNHIFDLDMKIADFSNNVWSVYFAIAYGIIVEEKKESLDEITIGLYLEKHLKLKKEYLEYDGYNTIASAMKYVKEENLDGYVAELKKWKSVTEYIKNEKSVFERLSDYVDMSSEEIYGEKEAFLNNAFVGSETGVKVSNPLDGLYDLIDELDEGSGVGMPLDNADILNNVIGGINFNGNIYGIGAPTGGGKSTTAINYLMPSVLKFNEKIVFMINEEEVSKVQKELLIWVSNNIYKYNIKKYILRNGSFSEDVKAKLKKCADYLTKLKDNKNITVVALDKYNASKVIKIIKKYSSLGCRLFVLDTFKAGDDVKNRAIWEAMKTDSEALHDVVKPSGKNVALILTYQVSKGSIRTRHYTSYDVGQGKSILDVMAVNIMMRSPFEDEYEGGRNEISYKKRAGREGKTEISRLLDKNKRYMITFITKNRFGDSDSYQVVSEYDLSTNVHKDVGICHIPEDF